MDPNVDLAGLPLDDTVTVDFGLQEIPTATIIGKYCAENAWIEMLEMPEHRDRSFAAKGFGSVVTGTLVGNGLSVGDTVEIVPSGVRGRVRGIQNHGVDAERGVPGMRCAINLQGTNSTSSPSSKTLKPFPVLFE